jgi:hypothetical protein
MSLSFWKPWMDLMKTSISTDGYSEQKVCLKPVLRSSGEAGWYNEVGDGGWVWSGLNAGSGGSKGSPQQFRRRCVTADILQIAV